jgi:hypothetical protein
MHQPHRRQHRKNSGKAQKGKTAVIAIEGNSLMKDENHPAMLGQFEADRQNCTPLHTSVNSTSKHFAK